MQLIIKLLPLLLVSCYDFLGDSWDERGESGSQQRWRTSSVAKVLLVVYTEDHKEDAMHVYGYKHIFLYI